MEQPLNEGMAPRSDDNLRRHSDHGRRGGGIVWPLILIGAGVVFLLNNLGVLDWNVWWTLARLWPMLLIAIGLDILIGRRSMLGSAIVALLVLGLAAAAVIWWAPQAGASVAASTQQVSQALQGASRASVDISGGTASLTLREGPASDVLVQGSVMLGANERLESDFSKSGDTATYRLHSQQVNPINWFNQPVSANKRWDLQLNPDVPMSLRLNAGVGNATVDLSLLKITSLIGNAGVGNLDLTLPRSGQLTANLDAGVGKLRVIVPAGMAASITVDRGLGGIDVGNTFQKRGDNQYVTSGYDTASNRVDMKINGGVGHISIEQQAGG